MRLHAERIEQQLITSITCIAFCGIYDLKQHSHKETLACFRRIDSILSRVALYVFHIEHNLDNAIGIDLKSVSISHIKSLQIYKSQSIELFILNKSL